MAWGMLVFEGKKHPQVILGSPCIKCFNERLGGSRGPWKNRPRTVRMAKQNGPSEQQEDVPKKGNQKGRQSKRERNEIVVGKGGGRWNFIHAPVIRPRDRLGTPVGHKCSTRRTGREEKPMELDLHEAIAPPRDHLLKERFNRASIQLIAALPQCRQSVPPRESDYESIGRLLKQLSNNTVLSEIYGTTLVRLARQDGDVELLYMAVAPPLSNVYRSSGGFVSEMWEPVPHRSGLPAGRELSKLVFGLRPAEIDERLAEIPAAIQVNENVSRLSTASGHAMSFL
ncbi:hypothetical protein B0H14DRAFT_3130383 [Mycena olivaceomarginata]|nr:hypothetical protein B0H14DRAFT_3130383 [Mycena olivaceomarginata]